MAFNPRRYSTEFLGTMMLYTATVIGSRIALERIGGLEPHMVILVAVAPVIPALLATAVFFRHFNTMDEMFKALHTKAFAAAALIVGLGTFSLGFLADAGAPQPGIIWVLPAMIAVWGLFAAALNARQ